MESKIQTNNPIKLTILDLFPSFTELNPKHEEMLLIFQGLNTFFNLKEILSSQKKIEIENNNQSSLIISLIKSNNIIATGFINIKQGEQWITMNYENKNKKLASNLALSLIDCIKLKIFCDIKNKTQINTTFNNISINSSALNLNTNSNYTNRNITKTKHVINQINLKITKRNTNKTLLKGSPLKTNYNQVSTKRSPNKNLYDINNQIKVPFNEEVANNNNNNTLIKSNNFNTFNYMSVNINMNPYTTISKCSIKKIDLNSSNKTRNSKIAKKKSSNNNYTSLRATNNNLGIKKMNTSTCSLNTVNKNNKNKKSRLTPDIEVKELKNVKGVGGSPGPNYSRKKKIDMDLYDNLDKSNERSPFYHTKLKNFPVKEMKHNNEDNNTIGNKKKRKSNNNYSNNINDNNINLNSINNTNNHFNINMNMNMNRNITGSGMHKISINNKCRTIGDNNFNNTFNNTFNNINKQVIKNKLLYNSKAINLNNNPILHINNTINCNSTNTTKKICDLEGSANSFDEEEKNKTKESSKKKCDRAKIGIYTTKRIDIKKNNNQIINKKLNSNENSNKLSHKILIKSGELSSVDNDGNIKNELSDNKNNNIKIDEFDKIETNNAGEDKDININNNINDDGINQEDDIDEYDENDNYTRIKEDFVLLYNDDYVNNIQDDLLKLEIELFIEKMTDLISCYHMQIEEKRFENELFQNEYNVNSAKFKEINKLMKKLEMIKIEHDIHNMKSSCNKKSIKKQDKIDLIVTKTEIEIFKNIFPDNENKDKDKDKNKKNMLKSIIMNVLKKEENRNLLSNDQNFNNWIDLCNKKNEINTIKTNMENNTNNENNDDQQLEQNDNNCNNNDSFNNIDNNNNALKNNNSYYNLDNTYKKKLPISPIYPKNNKYIPGSEVVGNKNIKEY